MPGPLVVRLVLVPVLFLVGAGSLVGCGGDSAPSVADYSAAVVQARDRVDFALERVTTADSAEELLNRMDEAAVVIDGAASELDDVGAAEGFDGETSKLVGALYQLSTDLEAFAHDARQPGGEVLLLGGPGLNFDSWDDANEALASLREQGIEVEPIGRH
jgi:hypothetical protein